MKLPKHALFGGVAAFSLFTAPMVALADVDSTSPASGDAAVVSESTVAEAESAPAPAAPAATDSNGGSEAAPAEAAPVTDSTPGATPAAESVSPRSVETVNGDEVVTLDLYMLTDIHGHIEQVKSKGKVTEAGLSAMGCYLNKARQTNPDSSFTLLGDNIGASTFASGMLKDNPTIEALNLLKPIASTLGNHELDNGVQEFKDRVDGTNGFTKIGFPYLAMNVEGMGNKADGTPYLGKYKVWESPSGVKVAFIGAIANDVEYKVSPGAVAGLTFNDPTKPLNDLAKKIKADKEADIVIAMLDDDVKVNYPKMGSAIDGLMGGDTHVPYEFDMVNGAEGNKLSGVASGSYTDNLGDLRFTFNKKTGKVVSSDAILIPASEVAQCGDQADVKAVVEKAVVESNEKGKEVVATSKYPYYRGVFAKNPDEVTTPGSNRGIESTLGDIVADAMRVEVGKEAGKTIDIGIMNAGGLREDLVPNDKGEITYRDVYDVLPFSNDIGYVEITGQAFKDTLEQQWKTNLSTQNSRPLLKIAVSDNVGYIYDPSRPIGDRITAIEIDGKPIDLAKKYTVASVVFLLEGGDTFPALTTGTKPALVSKLDRDVFARYLKEKPYSQPIEKRSIGVTLPTEVVKQGDTINVALRGLSFSEGPLKDAYKSVTVYFASDDKGTADINNSLYDPNSENEKAIITTDGAGQALVPVTMKAETACKGHEGQVINVPLMGLDPDSNVSLSEAEKENLRIYWVGTNEPMGVKVECAKAAPAPAPGGDNGVKPEPTKPIDSKPAPVKPGKPLAHTGASVAGMGIAALTLIAAGAVAAGVSRRRA
ncbi:bifunctional metallophosphatase/5'-nucleotidase [Trueperella sp. LYQ143]|uniref:bifunctional metallophosphatase/5'-nucleotidase n=1 Tax=unclassified Trueperella TaxID=2630174 RepID=UPI003983A441